VGKCEEEARKMWEDQKIRKERTQKKRKEKQRKKNIEW
jgi:hypothetical protein